MNANTRTMLRRIATKTVLAALPIAMASAYASGLFLDTPREASTAFAEVAEITNAPTTIGVADSGLIWKTPAQINTTLDQLQSLGVTSIRVLVPWAILEQADNVYYWKPLDNVMTAAAAHGIAVMADINSTPAWASTTTGGFVGSGVPNPVKFGEFVGQVASRYTSQISAYEIWNEPNWTAFYQTTDPVTYTNLLKAAYPIIKSIDPTATVVAGALGAGTTSGWTLNPVDFVKGMMAAGAGNYFDALSFHPYQESLKFSAGYTYPGLQTPLVQLDAIKKLIGTTKSIWISEYGLPTNNVTQAQQSAFVQDLLNYWQTYTQAGPVFLYTSVDNAVGSTNPEDNYGLFTANWTPKQVAVMLKAWIAAHPTTTPVVTPTTPTTPTTPANSMAALLAALTKQYTAAITAVQTNVQKALTTITAPVVKPVVKPASSTIATTEPVATASSTVTTGSSTTSATESSTTSATGSTTTPAPAKSTLDKKATTTKTKKTTTTRSTTTGSTTASSTTASSTTPSSAGSTTDSSTAGSTPSTGSSSSSSSTTSSSTASSAGDTAHSESNAA